MAAVLEGSRAKGSELLVLLLVANHAGGADQGTWVSAATLAREARMSERQIRRILGHLEELGEISREHRRGQPTILRVTVSTSLSTPDTAMSATPDKMSDAEPRNTPDIAMSGTPDIAMSPEPSEPSEKNLLREDAPKTRERDPAFDALAEACGADPRHLTRRYAQTVGVALADIRHATPSVSPAEIRRRARRWREVFPNASLTPMALAKHWPALEGPPSEDERRAALAEIAAGGEP